LTTKPVLANDECEHGPEILKIQRDAIGKIWHGSLTQKSTRVKGILSEKFGNVILASI